MELITHGATGYAMTEQHGNRIASTILNRLSELGYEVRESGSYTKLESEAQALREEVAAYEEGMRSLACQLGAGGFNAEQLTAAQLVDKVQWGINNIAETQVRLLDEVRSERDALRARLVVDERAEFEKFAAEWSPQFSRAGKHVTGGRWVYHNHWQQNMWETWQGRARLNGKAVDFDALEAEAQALREEVAALRARVVITPDRKVVPEYASQPMTHCGATGWNACLDEVARLSGKTVSEGLLRRVCAMSLVGEHIQPDRLRAMFELSALLEEGKES